MNFLDFISIFCDFLWILSLFCDFWLFFTIILRFSWFLEIVSQDFVTSTELSWFYRDFFRFLTVSSRILLISHCFIVIFRRKIIYSWMFWSFSENSNKILLFLPSSVKSTLQNYSKSSELVALLYLNRTCSSSHPVHMKMSSPSQNTLPPPNIIYYPSVPKIKVHSAFSHIRNQ